MKTLATNSKEYRKWFNKLYKVTGISSWDFRTLKMLYPELYSELQSIMKTDYIDTLYSKRDLNEGKNLN